MPLRSLYLRLILLIQPIKNLLENSDLEATGTFEENYTNTPRPRSYCWIATSSRRNFSMGRTGGCQASRTFGWAR